MIAWNALRATFARWHDRILALLVGAAAVASLRSTFSDLPWTTVGWIAAAAGVLSGFGAGRLIAARLTFHACDGMLAADALDGFGRWRYAAGWQAIGLGLVVAVTAIARAPMLIASVPAFVAGAGIAAWFDRAETPTVGFALRRAGRTVALWTRRPVAGLSAAAVLFLLLALASALEPNARLAILGAGVVILALMLAGVDAAVVRFMAITGHGTGRTLRYHAGAVGTFLVLAVPGCWLALGPTGAGIAASVGAGILLLLLLRVLAYRLHHRRTADLVVSIIVGLLMLVAWAMPVALPVVAAATVWHFHRRGRAQTWLLA